MKTRLSEQGEGIFVAVIYGWDRLEYEDVTEEVELLEDVVETARELRQSWREDGQGSVQECNALKKLHEALDALEE